MTLEQQVVSLELAKQLKEVGYPQEKSLFYYAHRNYSNESPVDLGMGKGYATNYASPTVAELGEQLPEEILINDIMYSPDFIKMGDDKWNISYFGDNTKCLRTFMGNTEADVRAKMWIYLKENNLLGHEAQK